MNAQALRRDGAASLDLCYIACGRYDGFWELGLGPWDTAAGALIVTEAGGRVTDFNGGEFSNYKPEIVATNGLIHEQMITVIEKGKRAQEPRSRGEEVKRRRGGEKKVTTNQIQDFASSHPLSSSSLLLRLSPFGRRDISNTHSHPSTSNGELRRAALAVAVSDGIRRTTRQAEVMPRRRRYRVPRDESNLICRVARFVADDRGPGFKAGDCWFNDAAGSRAQEQQLGYHRRDIGLRSAAGERLTTREISIRLHFEITDN
jgi:hypothetical protein